jgi:hypothetical protein
MIKMKPKVQNLFRSQENQIIIRKIEGKGSKHKQIIDKLL